MLHAYSKFAGEGDGEAGSCAVSQASAGPLALSRPVPAPSPASLFRCCTRFLVVLRPSLEASFFRTRIAARQ